MPDRDDARDRLEQERESVVEQIASLVRDFDRIVASADLVATDDEHDPEGHTIAYERQQVAALLRDARLHLVDVEDALARLESGTYGVCDRCGGTIGAERLAALPAVRTCITCAAADSPASAV